MAADKATDFIKRNRPPRVQISYEDPYDSEKLVELPFVMGVMSDLSGNASKVEKPEVEEREFRDVTGATFDQYMSDVAPGTSFMVENKLSGAEGATKMGVELHFSTMEDFNPAKIAMQVEPLKKLLEARMQLANLQRYMAGKPKAMEQIEKLLADPELMAALAARGADEEKDS
ncbi:type VI secretion system protein ImpB [Rhodobacter aestuarii]|uniref:Type VI secretion system protein ImpB n=1 Tax=Rhodobacter aestuarii TaxID=453582 RepID=A0A1N7JVJ3_9RHOB|nr:MULTISPECIES: type VI secretion system contractile sheath small subunit [Rhodobacter]PTV95974.1 type VI secretion system protein ImpB [Rhodobacter aestuarii]SIS53301.1 type VI secretion system protein ImpB [Rhodobacter aestuarii]SOC10485.1 type VI secretion system protein ImpB [Rhodobacter sp. JA431]